MNPTKPSALEMQILSFLWDRGPSTAREVLEAMPDGKKRAYTSILSVMQVMEKKGLLTHTNRGVAHVYKAAVSRSKIIRPFVRKVMTEVFNGQPVEMMQTFLNESQISDDELAKIQKLLDQMSTSKPSKSRRRKSK